MPTTPPEYAHHVDQFRARMADHPAHVAVEAVVLRHLVLTAVDKLSPETIAADPRGAAHAAAAARRFLLMGLAVHDLETLHP